MRTDEEWRDIPGYEGLYQVSNKGRVRTLYIRHGNGVKKGVRLLHPSKSSTGYYKIELYKDGTRKTLKVHRLVGFAFLPNPDNLPLINHKDNNPLNNNVENLEWCTYQYNVLYAYENFVHENRKLKSKQMEIEIAQKYENGEHPQKILEDYGITHMILRGIRKRQNVKTKTPHENSKYKIPISELKEYFDNGLTNSEIAKIYNCPSSLIGRRRYQYKKGEI